jgi:hypothetical protein
MDTHRRHVELDEEAFFMRITRKGDYLYEGADMGILVMRGRLMTDDFKLTERAKTWIKAIHSNYQSIPTAQPEEITAKVVDAGGFKFL